MTKDTPDWKTRLEEQAALARLYEVRARPAARPAPPISRAVLKASAHILKEAGPAPMTLAGRWPEIVGEKLAAISEPLRVTPGKGGGTLVIRAPSAAAPMIQHAAEHILQRVNLASGSRIKALKIDQTLAPAKRSKRQTPHQEALSIEERHRLTATLTEVRTPDLRRALAELGEAVLTSSKGRHT